jgi:flavin-dependent thymidylate synthase
MQVRLAGFNIDKQLIDKLGKDASATPEVISAAYARISRSTKSVTELRAEARKDVVKARKSNQNIVFEMGHSSVAEHAVFNFDIIGISRYLAEYIQRSRLASFTEKSQRYVTLEGDYIIPAEIVNTQFENEYKKLVDKAFSLYQHLFIELKLHKEKEKVWDSKKDLEGAAKEDARYILPLCTKTQMGMTINARSLELLLRRLASLPLQEAKDLCQLLYDEVTNIAPSIVRYINADDFSYKTLNWKATVKPKHNSHNEVTLINCPQYPDDTILAVMMFEQLGGSYNDALATVVKKTQERKMELWENVFANIKAWHKMPRAFEIVSFTFELTMSASCYAQFKRHRLCTIIKAPYCSADGFVIPLSMKDAKQLTLYTDYLKTIESFADKVKSANPMVFPYLLTNAHRVRVLAKMNLRELYHFVRLRSDEHAQWEIQNLSHELKAIVKQHCPLSAKWLMGKSEFN